MVVTQRREGAFKKALTRSQLISSLLLNQLFGRTVKNAGKGQLISSLLLDGEELSDDAWNHILSTHIIVVTQPNGDRALYPDFLLVNSYHSCYSTLSRAH